MKITDEMVERAAYAYWLASTTDAEGDLPNREWEDDEREQFVWAARIVLEAALTEDDTEWEYAVRDRKGRILFSATAGAVEGDQRVRRRKSEWEPVEVTS